MIFNETNFRKGLRDLFCNAVTKIFGDSMTFLDFLENEKYSSTKYDCYLDYSGENYIINRETGEYINWYKLDHIGRCIYISTSSWYKNVPKWIEDFLVEFKESEDSNDEWNAMRAIANGTPLPKAKRKEEDCFQPNSNEKIHSSKQDHDEEVAKAFQLGFSFGFIEEGLKLKKGEE